MKILALVLIVCLAMTGCGSHSEPEIKENSTQTEKTKVNSVVSDKTDSNMLYPSPTPAGSATMPEHDGKDTGVINPNFDPTNGSVGHN